MSARPGPAAQSAAAVVTRIDTLSVVVRGEPRSGPADRLSDVADAVAGTQRAIDSLAGAATPAELIERATAETRQIGFTRALYSDIEHRVWLPRNAYALDDPDFARRFVEFGVAHSRLMTGWMVETEMLLSGDPILVTDAQSNPRVNRNLVRFAQSQSYVAAPVQASGVPVAMVHADRYPDGTVDDLDRRLLGVYARALGLAIERSQLVEQMRVIRRVSTGCLSGADLTVDDLTDHGARLADVDTAAMRPNSDVDRGSERLSQREWEVLGSIALGKTNAQIGAGLFLAESTVKVHVKRILRKLGAANRTEAAMVYHSLTRRGA
jgi:DNA-binding CsgD family transcriptional regulator